MLERLVWTWMAAAPLALLMSSPACGDDSTEVDTGGAAVATSSAGEGGGATTGGPGSTSATSTGPGSGGEGGAGGGDGGGSTSPFCTPEALALPETATTYYVAIDEPGADNDACDGLSPTDEGEGRCPFRDFSTATTRDLLIDTSDVRVEVRAGTYVIEGWDGLQLIGAGDAPLVLAAFPGESPVFDVAAPDGATCREEDAPERPECVRQVIRVNGSNTIVQGLTVHNGLGYHLEVNGGTDHVVRCNAFSETVAFDLRSDMLKLSGGATGVDVQGNAFSRWRSQAIDVTGVVDVVIEGNDFTDPVDADGGAIGTKLGVRNVVIRGNTVHDLGDDPSTHVFALGGTGLPHDNDHAAYEIQLIGNRVERVRGFLAKLVSCRDCVVEGNQVGQLAAGIFLAAEGTGEPQCEGSPEGCLPTSGTRIEGNVVRGLDGAGDPASANVFVIVDEGQAEGLVGGDNAWCAPAPADARFLWEGEMLTFAAWVEASGTDQTSAALADDDPACELGAPAPPGE